MKSWEFVEHTNLVSPRTESSLLVLVSCFSLMSNAEHRLKNVEVGNRLLCQQHVVQSLASRLLLLFQNTTQIRRRIPNRLQGLVIALAEDQIQIPFFFIETRRALGLVMCNGGFGLLL